MKLPDFIKTGATIILQYDEGVVSSVTVGAIDQTYGEDNIIWFTDEDTEQEWRRFGLELNKYGKTWTAYEVII